MIHVPLLKGQLAILNELELSKQVENGISHKAQLELERCKENKQIKKGPGADSGSIPLRAQSVGRAADIWKRSQIQDLIGAGTVR